jgi:hypothetical protein
MTQEFGYDPDICFDIALCRNPLDYYSLDEVKLARARAHQRISDIKFNQGNVSRPATRGLRALGSLRKSLDKLGISDDTIKAYIAKMKSLLNVEHLADLLAMSYLLETRGAWPGWGMGAWGYDWKADYAARVKLREEPGRI